MLPLLFGGGWAYGLSGGFLGWFRLRIQTAYPVLIPLAWWVR